MYVGYVDDILILADTNIEEIKKLQETFQNNFVLKFINELNIID